jgi:hypothetical protein
MRIFHSPPALPRFGFCPYPVLRVFFSVEPLTRPLVTKHLLVIDGRLELAIR